MERGNIAKDSLKLTASKMTALLIGMVSAMLLSRFRTLEEYGTYSQMFIIAGIVSPIIMMGIPDSIMFFVPKRKDAKAKMQFISMNLLSTTVLGALTGILLFIMKPFLVEYFSNPMLGSLIFAVAVFPWARTLNTTVEKILVVYNKSAWLIVFKIAHSSLILAAVLVTVSLKLDFGIYMIMFIGLESLFAVAVYFIAAYLAGGLRLYFNVKLMQKVLKYSIPLGLSSSISSINRHVDKLIIGRFFSTEDLAIYTNAARELPFRFFGVSLAMAILPRLVMMIQEKRKGRAAAIWKEAIGLTYVVMAFVSTVLIVYANEIISILYSDKYLPGVPVFRVYSILMLVGALTLSTMINAIGKTRFILYSTIAAIGFNIAFSILLYNILGFAGPAVATLIATLILTAIQISVSAKLTDTKIRKLLPWKSIGIMTAVNIAFGTIFVLIKQFVPLDDFIGQKGESIIFGSVWTAVYFAIYFGYIKGRWNLLNEGGLAGND